MIPTNYVVLLLLDYYITQHPQILFKKCVKRIVVIFDLIRTKIKIYVLYTITTTQILEEAFKKEDGLNTILKTTPEALMKAERSEDQKTTKDYGNGYETRKAFGNRKRITLRVPRTQDGFYSVILEFLKN